jgi:hypothetical protein
MEFRDWWARAFFADGKNSHALVVVEDVVQQPVLISAMPSILKPGGSVTLGPAFFL